MFFQAGLELICCVACRKHGPSSISSRFGLVNGLLIFRTIQYIYFNQ